MPRAGPRDPGRLTRWSCNSILISADDDLYVSPESHRPGRYHTRRHRLGVHRRCGQQLVAGHAAPYMVDIQIFGLSSSAHHLMNVIYHALAAVVLFVVFRRSTREFWPSVLCRLPVRAIHIAMSNRLPGSLERKDVLSALFCFIALYAYVRHVQQPAVSRDLVVMGLFALGLMSKPMLVTFPFLILLLDFWPLRRSPALRLLWVKLPLFEVSAAVSGTTYWAQHSTGAVAEESSQHRHPH